MSNVTSPSLPSLREARVEPVGDRCLLIRVAARVDLETSRTVHALTTMIAAQRLKGVQEVVPAFNSVAVHYCPSAFRSEQELPSVQLTRQLEALLARDLPPAEFSGRVVEIPACYGGEFGPDLEDVAGHCGVDANEVIALHSRTAQTLYAFFFSPGNPFAGPLDERLHIGRRASPRSRVEAGSVAIANGLTAIYQSASPGGWNVIARTPLNLFDVNRQPPTVLGLGDQLRFKPISPDEFHALREAR